MLARCTTSAAVGSDQEGWSAAACEAMHNTPAGGAARDRARRVAGAIAGDVRCPFSCDIGLLGTMPSQDAKQVRMNLIAGYAYVGAWLGGVLGLCGMTAHFGAVDASAVLGLVGALLGSYRARKAADDARPRGEKAR